MLTVVLFVFGFVFIAWIALLFLASIAIGKLSHGWFLEGELLILRSTPPHSNSFQPTPAKVRFSPKSWLDLP